MRTPTNECVSPDIVDTAAARSTSGPASARPGKAAPQRRCILSGDSAPREGLIRLAISPDGDVLPDPLAKAPGRGAWIGVTRAELEAAMAKGQLRGALARAYKGAPLSVPDDLPALIQAALTRSLLDRLGLELRTGTLVLGSDRIAEQARCGAIGLLLHASDSSEGGRRKLDQALRVGLDAEGSGLRGTVLPLDRAALSVALGRENVVHLGVTEHGRDGGGAGRIRAILARLQHFGGALAAGKPVPVEEDGALSQAPHAARPDGVAGQMDCEG